MEHTTEGRVEDDLIAIRCLHHVGFDKVRAQKFQKKRNLVVKLTIRFPVGCALV